MWLTVAYITPHTAPWDVEFYKSKRRYTPQQFKQYVARMKELANINNVRMLELTVFDGEREIWSGMV